MDDMKRYAIYYAPQDGSFATAAAAWLGWDLAAGRAAAQPSLLPDMHTITADPRKYGFHGTIKPPFRLAKGTSRADLAHAVQRLAASLPSAHLDRLEMTALGGFLAFVPKGDLSALSNIAGQVVRELDAFRAPLTAAEIARRRPDSLTDRQRDLLAIYGYPYVMEEFQFHLTLTGRLDDAAMARVKAAATAHFAGAVPCPFVLGDLCLCGEDAAGQFHLLHRYPLMA